MVHPSKRSERSLETWESWVDEAVRDAKDRGEFDNLPGTGKLLNLDRNPLAGDRELAFHMLKNAEVLPPWMELDRGLRKAQTDLEESLRQVTARIDRLRAQACGATVAPATAAAPKRKSILRWLRSGTGEPDHGPRSVDPAAVKRERLQARARYLERAASLDKQIVEYNATLPNEIRHLERLRLTPDLAAGRFDAACPRIDCG